MNPVTLAIRACIKASGLEARFINANRCWWLAYVVTIQVPGATIEYQPKHCLIRYEGKLYDAEHPLGNATVNTKGLPK